MEVRGIDVSFRQGEIDWEAVAKDNVNFAMVQASYGSNGVDKMFHHNMKAIEKTSINRGAYHYSFASSVDEAKQEAQHFLEVISEHKFNYPVALMMQDYSISNLDENSVTSIIETFCNIVENAGYYVCVYYNLNWGISYISPEITQQFDLWIAQWNVAVPYSSSNIGIWQYSDHGHINGIKGNANLNISYKDYPSIIAESKQGETGISESQVNIEFPQNKTGNFRNQENEYKNIINYRVVPGDSLWSLADRFLGDGRDYRKIYTLNGLTSDLIYPGQVLKIPTKPLLDEFNYTVMPGDGLWNLAERFLGSGRDYRKILELNKIKSKIIYPGQVLRIPIINK